MRACLQYSYAIDRDLHIGIGQQVHNDHCRAINLGRRASGRVFASDLGCLVEKMRSAELLLMTDEALQLDRAFIVTAQLDDRVAQARPVFDCSSTSFGQVSSAASKRIESESIARPIAMESH